MKLDSKILVTGSGGMVGKSLLKNLIKNKFSNVLSPKKSELDLLNQNQVENYLFQNRPEYIFHLGAIVGGIKANNNLPAKFIYENTQMHCNMIHFSNKFDVKKVLIPGSACSYPKYTNQPILEESILTGSLEPTNIAYATSKINAIIMAQSYNKQYGLEFVIPMPTNTYGEGDHFNPENSHVIPALFNKFYNAKKNNLNSVELWGTGDPLREFVYVDDLSEALIFLMQNYSSNDIINVGTMEEISISELSKKISNIVGYKGKTMFDNSKPDGMKRKCLDSSKIFNLGWRPSVKLNEGLERTYEYFIKNI